MTVYATTTKTYLSRDAGATWSVVPQIAGSQIVVGSDRQNLFAWNFGQILRSVDGGATGSTAMEGIALLTRQSFISFVRRNRMDQSLYAVVTNSTVAPSGMATSTFSIYRSTDGGQHWFALFDPVQPLSIESLTSRGATLFVGTQTGVHEYTVASSSPRRRSVRR